MKQITFAPVKLFRDPNNADCLLDENQWLELVARTPHITQLWDENNFPICVSDCPKCKLLKL